MIIFLYGIYYVLIVVLSPISISFMKVLVRLISSKSVTISGKLGVARNTIQKKDPLGFVRDTQS